MISSTFGGVAMHRKISYSLFALAILILLIGDHSNRPTDEAIIIAQSEIYPYTQEELSDYDGERDQPAYIAIDHQIYDVSDLEELDEILEKYPPGQDITELIEDDPLKEVILSLIHI